MTEAFIHPIDPPIGACFLHKPEIAKTMPVSAVYFVLATKTGLMKIGYAKNAWGRLSALQVGSPERLAMIGMIETYLPIELERSLHAHFARLRAHGEWFRLSHELVDYVVRFGREAWDDDEEQTSPA